MINNRPNVSRYQGTPPAGEGSDANRKISSGPLYPVEEVMPLVDQVLVNFWTRGSVRDSQKWKLDAQDAADLVASALSNGRFLGAEWCEQKPSGPWAACDAYLVKRLEWNEAAHKSMSFTYYIKFAISNTGQVLLMASNHPEGA